MEKRRNFTAQILIDIFKSIKVNLHFARIESKQAEVGSRWIRQPLQAHQSSLQVYLKRGRQIAEYLAHYRGEVVSEGP